MIRRKLELRVLDFWGEGMSFLIFLRLHSASVESFLRTETINSISDRLNNVSFMLKSASLCQKKNADTIVLLSRVIEHITHSFKSTRNPVMVNLKNGCLKIPSLAHKPCNCPCARLSAHSSPSDTKLLLQSPVSPADWFKSNHSVCAFLDKTYREPLHAHHIPSPILY